VTKDLVRLACITGYIALGLFAAWRAHASPGPAARRAVNAFLLYTLAAGFGAGLLQKDLWPFSNWPLVAAVHEPYVRHFRLVAVDRVGGEHDVDYRAWQPFVSDELLAWAQRPMFDLEPADRERAAEYLLTLAEAGRQAARRGERVGYFDRLWGPLAAPYFLLHPKLWSTPATTPAEPLVALRLYQETWNLDDRRKNPSAVQRTVIYEYRAR
jgi:hypothetical protein